MKNLKLALEEIKIFYKKLLAYTIIIMCIFGVGLSILACAIHIPQSYKSHLNSVFPDGVSIRIRSASEEDTAMLKKHGAQSILSDINLNAVVENLQKENTISVSGQAIDFQGIMPKWMKNESFLLSGEKYSDTEAIDSIWISDSLSNDLNLNVGSQLKFFTVKGENIIFYVKGIFDKEFAPSGSDMYMRLMAKYQLFNIDNTNIIVSCKNASELFRLYPIIKSNNFELIDISGATNLIAASNTIEAALYSVMTVIFIAGVIVTFVLFNMFLLQRNEHIGILKALGDNPKDITLTYFIIMEIVVILAFIFGSLLSLLINTYIQNLAVKILGFNLAINFQLYAFLIAFVAFNIALLFVLYFIYRRIKNVSVTQIITVRG